MPERMQSTWFARNGYYRLPDYRANPTATFEKLFSSIESYQGAVLYFEKSWGRDKALKELARLIRWWEQNIQMYGRDNELDLCDHASEIQGLKNKINELKAKWYELEAERDKLDVEKNELKTRCEKAEQELDAMSRQKEIQLLLEATNKAMTARETSLVKEVTALHVEIARLGVRNDMLVDKLANVVPNAEWLSPRKALGGGNDNPRLLKAPIEGSTFAKSQPSECSRETTRPSSAQSLSRDLRSDGAPATIHPYTKIFTHIVDTLHRIEGAHNGGRVHRADVAGLLPDCDVASGVPDVEGLNDRLSSMEQLLTDIKINGPDQPSSSSAPAAVPYKPCVMKEAEQQTMDILHHLIATGHPEAEAPHTEFVESAKPLTPWEYCQPDIVQNRLTRHMEVTRAIHKLKPVETSSPEVIDAKSDGGSSDSSWLSVGEE